MHCHLSLLGCIHCSVWLKPQPHMHRTESHRGPGVPGEMAAASSLCREQARRGCRGAKGPRVSQSCRRCRPSPCPACSRGAKCQGAKCRSLARSLDGCVRSPQEGGKEAGGAFTTRRGPDRSDKEEGSRRRCGSELTTPQTAGVLQLAPRGLQKWRLREGRLRPLPAVWRKPSPVW